MKLKRKSIFQRCTENKNKSCLWQGRRIRAKGSLHNICGTKDLRYHTTKELKGMSFTMYGVAWMESIICRWTTPYRSKAYSLMYIPFMCRKPAARHQNKISSRTNAKVPHLLEWKMAWSTDSVAFTCKGFYFLCNVNNKAQGWFWSTSTEDKSSYMKQNFSEETWILPRYKCGNLMMSPLIYMIMQMQMPPEDDTDDKRKTRGQITGIKVIEYLFYMVTSNVHHKCVKLSVNSSSNSVIKKTFIRRNHEDDHREALKIN